MQGKKLLQIAKVTFMVLAWVSVAFFLIVSVIVLFGAGGAETPRAASIIFLLGGALYFIILLTISEVLGLLMKMSDQIDDLSELLKGKSA